MAGHQVLILLAIYLTIQTVAGAFFKPSGLCFDAQKYQWTIEGMFMLEKDYTIRVKIKDRQLCLIDLGHCVPKEIPDEEKACYCTQKEDNRYHVVIMSKMIERESGLDVKASSSPSAFRGSISMGKVPSFALQSSSTPGAYDLFGDGSEWRLFFRGTAGVQKSMYDVFTGVAPSSKEPGCKQVFSTEPCNGHYLDGNIVRQWAQVKKVAYVLFKEGLNYAGHMTFDARGTTNLNFFAQTKLLDASWNTLKRWAKTNYFSTEGTVDIAYKTRRFYVSHLHHGCPGDQGWIVTLDQSKSNWRCNWEKSAKYGENWPVLLYSKIGRSVIWEAEPDLVGSAAYVGMFVQY